MSLPSLFITPFLTYQPHNNSTRNSLQSSIRNNNTTVTLFEGGMKFLGARHNLEYLGEILEFAKSALRKSKGKFEI